MKTTCSLAFGFLGVALLTSALHAQHLRIFACAIGNDSAGAFMGGSSNGAGLYQSDDTGKTWRHLGWNNIKCFSMDMVQSSNGRILYEATGLGVLRSVDGGEHWKQLTDWRISEVMDVAVNQKNPSEIYIATAHGPWRTRDGGKIWSRFDSGLGAPFCSSIVYDTANYSHLFIGSATGIFLANGNRWQLTSNHTVNSLRQFSAARWKAACDDGALYSNDSGKSFHLIDSGRDPGYVRRLPSWKYLSVTGATASLVNPKMGAASMTLWTGSGGIAWIESSDIIESSFEERIRNVSSAVLMPFPDELRFSAVLGTLGTGIYVLRGVSVGMGDQYLAGRQIWTLKSFLVTP